MAGWAKAWVSTSPPMRPVAPVRMTFIVSVLRRTESGWRENLHWYLSRKAGSEYMYSSVCTWIQTSDMTGKYYVRKKLPSRVRCVAIWMFSVQLPADWRQGVLSWIPPTSYHGRSLIIPPLAAVLTGHLHWWREKFGGRPRVARPITFTELRAQMEDKTTTHRRSRCPNSVLHSSVDFIDELTWTGYTQAEYGGNASTLDVKISRSVWRFVNVNNIQGEANSMSPATFILKE